MEKKNTGLVVLVIILFLLVVGLSGFIVYDKVLSSDKKESSSKENINDKDGNIDTDDDKNIKGNDANKSYKLGDSIILPSLSNVDYSVIGFPGESRDFSQWIVLREDGDYIILYYSGDELLYGKNDRDITISVYKERRILFESNGIDFGKEGEIRILNESDLVSLGCNFETLDCPNIPDKICSWTTLSKNNNKYALCAGELDEFEEDAGVAVFSDPVLKILKSNIK